MAETPRIEVEDGGITVREGDTVLGSFPWGTGEWTLRITDTRVRGQFQEPLFAAAKVTLRPTGENPRVTSLDREGRDQDRDLLGLIRDEKADEVLLTNRTLEGTLKLHYGALHAHSLALTDEDATRLVVGAFQRGFEVRRSVAHIDGLGPSELVTEITTRRASETLETEAVRRW
ncbi:MAG TPA: hypothetical protein VIZ68_05225 [Thermoplasmata archaeon]